MIQKTMFLKGIKVGVVATTIAVTSSSISSTSVSKSQSTPYTISSLFNNQNLNSCINNIESTYYSVHDKKEELINIFGETRDFNERELEIYKKIMNKDAQETGFSVF